MLISKKEKDELWEEVHRLKDIVRQLVHSSGKVVWKDSGYHLGTVEEYKKSLERRGF